LTGVRKTGNVEADDVRDRKTGFNVLRQMAMELSYRCSNYKQREIGAIFGADHRTVARIERVFKPIRTQVAN